MCNLVVVLERDFAESVISKNFSRVKTIYVVNRV